MKIGAIIQARASSQRLPSKVLKELPYGSNITVIEQVVRRLKRCRRLDDIIIATTTGKEDDSIVKIAEKAKAKWFRGDNKNVLSRYYLSAKENSLDVIVRITSDCPCIDPDVVDLVIERHSKEKADFTSNALILTYPHGLDTEVFNFDVLEKAFKDAKKDCEKEHVTPYMYENQDMFKCISVEAPKRHYAPDIRITLDTIEDYALLCMVFDCLYPQKKYFTASDIIMLFKKKPWLKLINKKVVQKKIIEALPEEIKEAVKILDLQGLQRSAQILKKQMI